MGTAARYRLNAFLRTRSQRSGLSSLANRPRLLIEIGSFRFTTEVCFHIKLESKPCDSVDDYVKAEMQNRRIPGLSAAAVIEGKFIKAEGRGLAAALFAAFGRSRRGVSWRVSFALILFIF
jgi:hypothetical protein